MKKAVLYLRVSTLDQNPQTQLHDLRQMAQQRGYEVLREYQDCGISGARTRRPALDSLLEDARRGKFDVVMVWACDRLARSVKDFLDLLDTFSHLNIEFVSFRENLDTGGPLGRAVMVIVGAIAELERSLIVERVRAGMRRARLEGRRLGRKPLDIDRERIIEDREINHYSLSKIAKLNRISKTTVGRVLKDAGPERCARTAVQLVENTNSEGAV
jgi:DNA invertase Pin-like site-specific DNA recombinase